MRLEVNHGRVTLRSVNLAESLILGLRYSPDGEAQASQSDVARTLRVSRQLVSATESKVIMDAVPAALAKGLISHSEARRSSAALGEIPKLMAFIVEQATGFPHDVNVTIVTSLAAVEEFRAAMAAVNLPRRAKNAARAILQDIAKVMHGQ